MGTWVGTNQVQNKKVGDLNTDKFFNNIRELLRVYNGNGLGFFFIKSLYILEIYTEILTCEK